MPGVELHHYVPRFVLRRFGRGKKDQLHTYDKSTGVAFSRAANKLAATYDYYHFEFMGEAMTVEPLLADLEAKAGKYIARIVEDRCLNLRDPRERDALAQFFAVQLVRTPAQMAVGAELFARMDAWLREQGMPDAYFAPDPHVGEGENAARAHMARRILNAPQDYGPRFIEKDWVLFETDPTHPYLIGDHPLVMHNENKSDLRGTIGLKVPGIEIYFPMSPRLTLGMLCPSIADAIYDRLARAVPAPADVDVAIANDPSPQARLITAMAGGTSVSIGTEGCVFFNSLQIANAERFVFSSNGEFGLLADMIGRDPSLKRGRRMHETTGTF
jgi:hypothetical protein